MNEQRTFQNKAINASKQSKLDFCFGYKSVSIPEFLTSDQNINLTNCAYCSNNEQYFVLLNLLKYSRFTLYEICWLKNFNKVLRPTIYY